MLLAVCCLRTWNNIFLYAYDAVLLPQNPYDLKEMLDYLNNLKTNIFKTKKVVCHRKDRANYCKLYLNYKELEQVDDLFQNMEKWTGDFKIIIEKNMWSLCEVNICVNDFEQEYASQRSRNCLCQEKQKSKVQQATKKNIYGKTRARVKKNGG